MSSIWPKGLIISRFVLGSLFKTVSSKKGHYSNESKKVQSFVFFFFQFEFWQLKINPSLFCMHICDRGKNQPLLHIPQIPFYHFSLFSSNQRVDSQSFHLLWWMVMGVVVLDNGMSYKFNLYTQEINHRHLIAHNCNKLQRYTMNWWIHWGMLTLYFSKNMTVSTTL